MSNTSRAASAYQVMEEIPPMQVPEESMRRAARCARNQSDLTRILEAVKWIGAWVEASWPDGQAKRDVREHVRILFVRIALVEHARRGEMWNALATACDRFADYFTEARSMVDRGTV